VTFAPRSLLIGFSETLVEAIPEVTVDTADIATVEEAVDAVLAGAYDLTLTERWIAEAVVGLHPELEIGAEFGEIRYTAAVRASAPDLLRLVNDFAYQIRLAGESGEERHADLPEIREGRMLRVLTVNGPSSYYVHRGELVGFDYELVRRFADEQNVIVQMIVAPSVEELEPWLSRGLGDMIGAGLLATAVGDTAAVRATRPYHDVWPVIVARPGLALDRDGGYRDRAVVVTRSNPYLPMLRALGRTVGYRLDLVTDTESTRELLGRLARGESDLTVLESHLAAAELAEFPDLVVIDSLTEAPGRSWAVRADQPDLLAALNAFVEREVGGLTHAVLVRKYFRPETRRVDPPEVREGEPLSPWDDIVRRVAADADLDWRLLTAQMFQESRFDPTALSPAGAYGLMQMMPGTFRQMRVRNREDPHEQIQAGVGYMRWLYDRFPSDLALADRLAFTLAAYNAGYGHVSDARRVAALRGLDPDRWFESVELAMLALSDPSVYGQARYGYVRGSEPVRYVRRINELGQMYARLAPSE
jgi:membrane-bound lytic murein transglycosylase F